MSKGRRKHSPAFNAKVALEEVEGQETIAQLATTTKGIPGRFRIGRRLSWRTPTVSSAEKWHVYWNLYHPQRLSILNIRKLREFQYVCLTTNHTIAKH